MIILNIPTHQFNSKQYPPERSNYVRSQFLATFGSTGREEMVLDVIPDETGRKALLIIGSIYVKRLLLFQATSSSKEISVLNIVLILISTYRTQKIDLESNLRCYWMPGGFSHYCVDEGMEHNRMALDQSRNVSNFY